MIHDESASAKPVSSDKEKPPQRLVVCLDGSWNKRGSGTNIYHIANLVQKGKVTKDGKTWRQRVYYDEGVGTGVLDRISGGAFGIGVSENVRQAYDWLVEKYNDKDEVYVFGFSRGAFTARSLVGLLSKCGLLYRGAPIPQEQLWDGYRKLGSKPEWRNDNSAKAWAKREEKGEISFRPLEFFKKDPWSKVDVRKAAKPTEELLSNWSRRIPITCLGVFDSVGTFGVEAVAIPWLQERRAQFHDTELSSCVLNAFHALAIDEHRANFDHLPLRRAIGHEPAGDKGRVGRIEQCWFIGAHTNVGGGCSDNALAQFPLKWMMDRCEDLGLVFRPVKPALEDAVEKCIPLHPVPKDAKGKSIPGNVGDSFSEFMGGIWRYALRNKPNYRWIAPPLEFQHGQAVKGNEEVDPSVEKIIRADQAAAKAPRAYQPPNLWAYLNRPKEEDQQSSGANDTKLSAADDKNAPGPDPRQMLLEKPEPSYLENWTARWWTAGWLFGIGSAGYQAGHLFGGGRWLWLVIIAPLLALAADVFESRVNHNLALDPRGPQAERRRSIYLDKLLNIRLFFLVASLVGVVFLLIRLVKWLSFAVPAWEVLWLFSLVLIAVRLRASWDWSALPIAELGNRWGGWFRNKGYAARFALPPEKDASDEVLEVRRSWKKRALFRDLVGFVPASIIAIGFGWWITLSLIPWVRGPLSKKGDIWGGLNLESRCWVPAAALSLLYLIFAIVENRRQAAGAPTNNLARSLWNWVATAIFWVGIIGFLAAIVGLAALQFWRIFCKGVFFLGNWMADHGWAVAQNRWVFNDLRFKHIEAFLPAWLGLIAACLALYTLYSALKQKPEPPLANKG